MRQLLLQYTVVGGLPEVVQCLVDTKHMDQVLKIQRDIIRSYKDDMIKYADKKDKSRITECFQSIPKQYYGLFMSMLEDGTQYDGSMR